MAASLPNQTSAGRLDGPRRSNPAVAAGRAALRVARNRITADTRDIGGESVPALDCSPESLSAQGRIRVHCPYRRSPAVAGMIFSQSSWLATFSVHTDERWLRFDASMRRPAQE